MRSTLRITKNLDRLNRMLSKLEGQGRRAMLKNVGEAAVGLVHDGFNESRDPYGEKWQPLSQDYLESIVPGTRRRRRSYGTRPLVRRGILRLSFNYKVREHGVEVGTPWAFAKFHQGDPTHPSRGRLPPRAMLPTKERGMPKRWRDDIIDAIEAHLEVSQ